MRPNVTGIRKKVGDDLAELEAEILIEQKPHIGAVTKRLSRSAA